MLSLLSEAIECSVSNWPSRLALGAPGLEPVAVLADLGDARVDVAVADVGVAGAVPGHVGRLAEAAVDRGQRRVRPLVRMRLAVGGFGLAPEHHLHAAGGVHLDDHVRALVGGPDVVFLVDAHRVRERPGVEVLADLADEAAVAIELEDLRGGGAEGVGDGAAARIDVDVALGVHRDARGLAQMHVRRQLDEIRNRVEVAARAQTSTARMRTGSSARKARLAIVS